MSRPIRAILDRAALRHNLQRVRQLAPDARIMAVLKADAYGHGLQASAHALQEADAFGLLDVQDAISLRQQGYPQRLCLLEGFFNADEIAACARYELEPVIHAYWQLRALAECRVEKPLDVWLKIDTGMHRLGFDAGDAATVLEQLRAMPQVGRITLMSHLANADNVSDDTTSRQLARLLSVPATDDEALSLANSAAVCAWPATHLNWVRPGIMLYGSSPLDDRDAAALELQPVMMLESELIAVRRLRRGDPVGYGGTWTCPEDMPVGVVACGYGDGYPRHAPNGTPVMVAGQRTALVGRVSMDMIAVDLRNVAGADVGSPVELWGRALSIDEVARHAQTIAYELLCGITKRVPRLEAADG
jgi:alanine racemase